VATRGSRALAGLLVAVAVLGVPGVAATPAARADSVSDKKRSVDSQIADLKDELEGASADLVAAAVELKKLEAQLSDARADLASAQAAREDAVRKDAEIASKLSFAQAELQKAEREIKEQEAAESETRATLGRIAREAYVGNRLSGLSVALQATTPEQFTEQLAVSNAALLAQSGAIDRISVVQAELRNRTSKLDAIRAEIAELKRQSEILVIQRMEAEKQAADAEARVSSLVKQEAAFVAKIQDKIDAEKSRLSSLEAEQAKLQAVLAERARIARENARKRRAGGWNPPPSNGFLSYPAPGGVTSGYGMRYHPILHYSRMHTGVDFGVPCGTPVHAAADGEVISAGRAGGYGNRVVIDHGEVGGGDLATTYNHLSRIVVGGGNVSRGELIAYSGTTGLSTGCHLHFETLVDGRYVNPMNYF
jgi:murein DD-endopeptidase MepM/ murein hydrolase activator NlpD